MNDHSVNGNRRCTASDAKSAAAAAISVPWIGVPATTGTVNAIH